MAKKPSVTSRGVFGYPHLHTPDRKFEAEGVYHLLLIQTPEEAAPLMAKLDAEVAESVKEAKIANPKHAAKITGVSPYNTEHDEYSGMVVFRFKLTADVTPKDKSKEAFSQKPALFDGKGVPLAGTVRIGGGSEGRVSYTTFSYYSPKDKEAGVSLRMVGVQVIVLREFSGKSAASLGFDVEDDGFDQGGSDFAPAMQDEDDAAPDADDDDDAAGAAGVGANGGDF